MNWIEILAEIVRFLPGVYIIVFNYEIRKYLKGSSFLMRNLSYFFGLFLIITYLIGFLKFF